MIVKIIDINGFMGCVFGADDFIQHFPEVLTSGIEVEKQDDDFFYVMSGGRKVHDTAFFSEEEMRYLTKI
jgi:hypothetical protein